MCTLTGAPNKASSRFDEATQSALRNYLVARNASTDELRLNQGLVDELSDQSVLACAPIAVEEARAVPGQPAVRSLARPLVKPLS